MFEGECIVVDLINFPRGVSGWCLNLCPGLCLASCFAFGFGVTAPYALPFVIVRHSSHIAPRLLLVRKPKPRGPFGEAIEFQLVFLASIPPTPPDHVSYAPPHRHPLQRATGGTLAIPKTKRVFY